MKERQQTIQQQLRQAESQEEKAALQKQLTSIEMELRAKNNDYLPKAKCNLYIQQGKLENIMETRVLKGMNVSCS